MPQFLIEGPDDAPATLLLAHGAGAAMDSPGMEAATAALVGKGLRIARFEFAYMAARRTEGTRKPPPKAEKLVGDYKNAVAELEASGPLFIGGKSMGGRVATMAADELHRAGAIKGVVCLGYPFHPPGKPDNLRTAHLENLETPAIICQGTRDQFGSQEEIAGYALSQSIEVVWFADGDHDLKPRKSVSGFTAAVHIERMAHEVAAWISATA